MRCPHSIVFAICICHLLTGCGGYTYHPVEVSAVDAVSRTPVSGARVRIDYPVQTFGPAPKEVNAVTDAAGMVTVQVPAVTDPRWRIDAAGYEPYQPKLQETRGVGDGSQTRIEFALQPVAGP